MLGLTEPSLQCYMLSMLCFHTHLCRCQYDLEWKPDQGWLSTSISQTVVRILWPYYHVTVAQYCGNSSLIDTSLAVSRRELQISGPQLTAERLIWASFRSSISPPISTMHHPRLSSLHGLPSTAPLVSLLSPTTGALTNESSMLPHTPFPKGNVSFHDKS